MADEPKPERNERGRWKKGESGNPKGRSRGSPVSHFREGLRKDLPELMEMLKTAARAGDQAAAKLWIQASVPPLRPVADFVEIPAKRNATLKDKADSVLELMLAGALSPTEAGEVFAAMSGHAGLTDLAGLKQLLLEWKESRDHTP